MLNLQTQMSDSAEDFLNIVWPRIQDCAGGGEIIPVEMVSEDAFVKTLDTLAGIDAWHVLDNKMGMRGIASRVQWHFDRDEKEARGFGHAGYCTFTIRYSLNSGKRTEWDKRTYAITNDAGAILFPYFTIQAYLEKHNGPFLSAAVIHTHELIELAHKYFHALNIKPAPGGNKFLIVGWNQLSLWGAQTLQLIAGDLPYGQKGLFE